MQKFVDKMDFETFFEVIQGRLEEILKEVCPGAEPLVRMQNLVEIRHKSLKSITTSREPELTEKVAETYAIYGATALAIGFEKDLDYAEKVFEYVENSKGPVSKEARMLISQFIAQYEQRNIRA